MSARLGRSAVLVAALGVLTGVGPRALGQQSEYQIEVWAIRATKEHQRVDAGLKPIIKELKKILPKHTGFVVEKRERGKVPKGKELEAKLVQDHTAKVKPVKREEKRVTLEVQISHKEKDKEVTKVNTKVTLDAGKFQLWNWKYDDDSEDMLIIGVRAR